MGLFDTLHHSRLAVMRVADEQRQIDFSASDGGTSMTYQDAWDQFRLDNLSDFLYMPTFVILALMLSMFLFHVLGSTILLKIMPNDTAISGLLLQGFHSIISPPLHIDWEYYYRLSDKRESVLESWRR